MTKDELGGVKVHAEISGTVDFVAKNDDDCLKMVRDLVSFYRHSGRKSPAKSNIWLQEMKCVRN